MKSFLRKLIWLIERRRKDAELREELEFHLDEEAEELTGAGLPHDQARWAAHRDLGNVALLHENVRAVWIWTFWERLVQDVRYGARMMRKSAAFTLLAVLSLALGIGANTAIYSFMDSILLRSLPVSDPDSLVIVQWQSPPRRPGGVRRPSVIHDMSGTTYDDPKLGDTAGIFPYPAFELLQRNDALFSSLFAYHPTRELNVMVHGQAEIAQGEYVSGNFFSGLGVAPVAGRMIVPGDDDMKSPVVAVASSGFSKRHFGEAANAVGQTITINALPVTIAGVAPAEFFGVDPSVAPDIYLPMHANVPIEAADSFGDKTDSYLNQNKYWIEIMGRLLPGVTRDQAQAALAPQFHQWVESTVTEVREQDTLPALVVRRGAEGVETLRRRYSQPLWILIVLAGLILAIACANIANLLLARGAARRPEIALRLSLGAGRGRVMRQLLTESVLLAICGGALGVLVAIWGIRFLTLLLANGQPDFTLHAELNWHVLSATAALSLLTGIVFGLAPALQSTKADVLPALKQIRTAEPRSRMPFSLSQILMVSQIALSLLLLVAAGLFARTLANLQAVQVGFNRENILLFQLDARKAGHKDPEISTFYGGLQTRFSAIPGVLNASFSHESLIDAGSGLDEYVPGMPHDPDNCFLAVGPGFFKTMQIPILAGRDIDERDQADSLKVTVVNELFARANFGDQNPLGRHVIIRYDRDGRDMVIVGVAANARYGGLVRKTPPVVYIPYNQGYPPPHQMVYELRTAGNPLQYVNTVRQIVHQADARVPVTDVTTQAADIDRTINQEIIFARLCSGFAILALVIACVGLYGTMSYKVVRRTSEIGIRMALGARRGPIVWMVLREIIVLTAVGLAISLPTALAASKLIRSFLFGLKPNDPLALTLSVFILVSAALLAGYLPARKAARIDPMIALRHE